MPDDRCGREIEATIGRSKAHSGALRSPRRHIARGLVRTEARLLPDKPEVIGGTVFVLPKTPNSNADQKAA
jgi:hypothetical protein